VSADSVAPEEEQAVITVDGQPNRDFMAMIAAASLRGVVAFVGHGSKRQQGSSLRRHRSSPSPPTRIVR